MQSPPRLGQPRGLPPTDYPRAHWITTEGVPLVGHFESHPPEVAARIAYNNHPAVADNSDEVAAKFAAEEEKSFHIILPKFFAWFILGLFLNPLQWAMRKGKGRTCVDCTNGNTALGSPNTFVKTPSAANADECPPVYCGKSFMRFLLLLWSMREMMPLLDILMHVDDLDAAFRRVLCHPDLAVVFAYVFLDHLIIPVGQVFGSRSAPSCFSLLSDLRAEVASTVDLTTDGRPLEHLAQTATIAPLPPEWNPSLSLQQACQDPLHPPLSPEELLCFANATFVDDNAVAGCRSQMRTALHQSIRSAFVLFGHPEDDRCSSCLNDEKWDPHVSHIIAHLGFVINSRNMTVTWPLAKRLELRQQILLILADPNHETSPKEIASVIGKIRSAAKVAPWGNYLSFASQDALTTALRKAKKNPRRFWKAGNTGDGKFRYRAPTPTEKSLCLSEILVLAMPATSTV
jgi:hypothetical protein